MKTGILTSGVSQDFEKSLKIIKNDGFDYIELQFIWDKEICHHSDEQNKEMKRLLDQYDIKVSAILKNLFSNMTIKNTEIGDDAYNEQIRILKKSIELARYFGTNITRTNTFDKQNVLFGSGGAENHVANNNVWKKFLKLMEPCCQIAEDEGIDLMMETGTGGLIHTAALAKKAIDELQCPRLKVLWDPANCLYSMESVPQGYEAIRDHIAEIHIKDLRFNKPMASIDYCLLGQGDMMQYIDDLATTLRQDKYDGVVVLENQVTPPGMTEEDGYHMASKLFKQKFS